VNTGTGCCGNPQAAAWRASAAIGRRPQGGPYRPVSRQAAARLPRQNQTQ